MKILIAEDNVQSRYLLEQFFAARGHDVWSAENGRVAIDFCRERGAPDAVVSDALMPVADGFELCDTVRRDPALQDLPFILYTATYTAESDERFALSIGVDRFVVKPTEPERLLQIVEELVAERRAGRVRPPRAAGSRDAVLQEYARLVSVKLEDKLAELSRANDALRASEESVRQLNEQLLATVRRLEREVGERRRTAELLRLAQEAGGIGTWECDAAGRLFWSAEAVSLLGQTPATFADFIARVAEADRPRAVDALLHPPPSGSIEVEVRYAAADGGTRHLFVRGGRSRPTADGPVRHLGIVQDVTARREAELRRQTLEQQLHRSQKMEALGNLAGGIAHDFNNILTAIIGHNELLRLELPRLSASPEVAASAEVVAEAAERAKDIVKQILTFSRRQPVERQPAVLARYVEGAVRLARATLPRRTEIRCQLASERRVVASETQIHQVLLNLCTNASHALSPDGGVVTITLADVELAPGDPALRPGAAPGPYVRLDVADSGCGMPPAVLERLFEPFFTTKPATEGTGLGLAVVHGIVQAHEGSITVASRPGHGTTFSLFFPALVEKPAPGAAGPTSPAVSVPRAVKPAPTGRGRRILAVDDEPSVARTCAEMLTRLGYEPVAVTSAVEARELFEREPDKFAGAVLDYLMPQLTGLDLARALWAKRPELPVVMVAGFGAQLDAASARSEGVSEFVAKPFTLTTLGDALTRALSDAPSAERR